MMRIAPTFSARRSGNREMDWTIDDLNTSIMNRLGNLSERHTLVVGIGQIEGTTVLVELSVPPPFILTHDNS